MPTNGRHHHNANAATWAQPRKPRTRPGHADWLSGVLVGVDAGHELLTVRVENAGRPSIHVGGEVTLNTSATIIKVGQDHGTSSVADLMVGDVLRVDLEPVSDGQAELADDHQDGINGPQGEDELLAAHRVVRVGGIGPAAVETDG